MKLNISTREFHTILAALRNWQVTDKSASERLRQISTNDGDVNPLSDAEVEALCQRLNTGSEEDN